jgi:hypothetical protein
MATTTTETASVKLEVALKNLAEAREALVPLVGEYADKGDYRSAKSAMELAQKLDEVTKGIAALVLGQDNGGKLPISQPTNSRWPSSFPTESKDFPFFYAEGDRLVMRGPSRDGTYYEQRIPKPHYDLIARKLHDCQRGGGIVRNQEMLNRAEMPVHEPGLILKLLASKGLLEPLQKGVYSFVDAADVRTAAQSVWDGLPRACTGRFG